MKNEAFLILKIRELLPRMSVKLHGKLNIVLQNISTDDNTIGRIIVLIT